MLIHHNSIVHGHRFYPLPSRNKRSTIHDVRATTRELQTFPASIPDAIRAAQQATKQALADGARLIEVEFPASGLASVSGDGEGATEMTLSMQHLRKFCAFLQPQAASTRVFFPDQREMVRARDDGGEAAVFGRTAFQLDFLTRPTLLNDLGLDLFKVDITQSVQPSDERFVCAYPHFNIGEMLAVWELYEGVARTGGQPIIVFNGELDRIRTGYYPPFFYPKLARMAETFLTEFTTALYVHNFKGSSSPGVLFRQYPGPWQVLQRDKHDGLTVIHTQGVMPSLKEVSLDILKRK